MFFTPSPSPFTETYVALNCPDLAGRFRWSFQPGMLFQDNGCWWKSSRRTRPHEGVDFCGYHAGRGGEERRADADLVPSLYDGVVVSINDDFLGQTVWMVHQSICCDKLVLFSAFGHMVPEQTLAAGSRFNQGETMGRIAPSKKGSPLAMHLHLSVFWAPSFLSAERLNWQDLPASRVVRMFDPLSIISRSA